MKKLNVETSDAKMKRMERYYGIEDVTNAYAYLHVAGNSLGLSLLVTEIVIVSLQLA
ncbi:hypothetical protein Leryth_022572, partial [Lithospermum erythrorhizon]